MTCFSGQDETAKSKLWIGLGCIFQTALQRKIMCAQNEWKSISENIDLLDDCDGQYVFLLFENNRLEIRTDKLGLRTFYWYNDNGNTIFSTRMDWIAKYLNGCQINFNQVGSRWLIYNQLSCKSLVKDIHRLGPGGKLIICENKIISSERQYQPDWSKVFSYDETISLLDDFVSPVRNDNLDITLGLSGGLDSRVLLSLLLKSNNKTFSSHTFGCLTEPDVSIPKEISKEENFQNIAYNSPFSTAHELIPVLSDYISATNLIEPISTVLRLRNYKDLNAAKFLLMDGGFGEIARRQYLNRLYFNGIKHILDGNIDAILKNLIVERANIFTPEITNKMEICVRSEIEYMLNSMPDPREIGIENYLDLWAVRTRFPNFNADEQSRLDAIILNFMPFAQNSFINMVFAMPVKLRKNGKLFRKIITESRSSLTNYPLVKNNITYPFNLSTKAAWLYTKIKSKLGYTHSDNNIYLSLEILKEFILDILLSQSTKEYPAYNYTKIKTTIEKYYSGNKQFANEINWWLSFELWRRGVENK